MKQRNRMTCVTRWLAIGTAALVFAAASAGVAAPAQAQIGVYRGPNDPLTMLRTGRYDEAIKAYSAVARSDSAWVEAQKYLALTYLTVGKLDEAERTARAGVGAPGGQHVANTLGEILVGRGKRAEAEPFFQRAVAQGASDSLTARLNLAILRYDRGDRDQAL
jgi:Flp pilus assembly protein TadD